jgi:hypothetical protein
MMNTENKPKRWSLATKSEVDSPAIDAFLKDLIEVYREHGFGLEHEDPQGGFIVEELDENIEEYLMGAFIGKSVSESNR